MMCNLTFLMSLKFIPFSKASVFFWMSPVFTALVAHFYLHEKLTIYDWGAVFIAFIGIIIIQNPFGERSTHSMEVGFWEDLIGSGLALLGALLASVVSISIRIITTRTKLHYMVIPMGFVIGNLLLCPVFLFTKVFITPVEQGNLIVTESPQGQIGSSFHVYSLQDTLIILAIAALNVLQQLAQTLAFKFEKAGRVAPLLYLQIIMNCVADIYLFQTKLAPMQVFGGLLIILTNFTIAVLKCTAVIK